MGKLQPAKIHYMAAWENYSLQKSITWLHGAVASSESILHSCLEVSLQAKVFYTAVWRFRSKRKHFTQLHEGFAPSEGILHSCLPFLQHPEVFSMYFYQTFSENKLSPFPKISIIQREFRLYLVD